MTRREIPLDASQILRALARLTLELAGPVLVAGIDDLISVKRAGGRPIGRSDTIALTGPAAESV